MEPVVMSGSSLSTYLRCPRQWEYAYVHRIRRPPRLRQALGRSAHTAIEIDLKHKIATWQDLPRDEVLQIFVDEFKGEVVDSVPEKGETVGGIQDSGVKSVGVWYDRVAPTIQPTLVEEAGQFAITYQDIKVPYNWTLDVVDSDRVIRDWKFVTRKPSTGQSYILSLIGYAVGYRHLTGDVESGVRLDHIVRTKKPYHHPLVSGPVDDRDLAAYSDVLVSAYKSIQAGSFPPTGLSSGACGWCGFRDICSAYREASLR